MLMLLVAQAATVPPALAAPPPIVTTPRVPMVTTIAASDRDAAPRVRELDVVIRSPAGPLWTGTLRVADRGGESGWSQTRSEPPAQACPTHPTHWGGERENLNLSLSMSGREAPDNLIVQARWARRGEQPCDGLRTVELRQSITVPDRGQAIVSGDGGLRVELRRR